MPLEDVFALTDASKSRELQKAGKTTLKAEVEVATNMPAKIESFRRAEQAVVRAEVGGDYSNALYNIRFLGRHPQIWKRSSRRQSV